MVEVVASVVAARFGDVGDSELCDGLSVFDVGIVVFIVVIICCIVVDFDF